MTKRGYLARREEYNRLLAKRDADNRCAYCKRNLRETGQIVEGFLIDGRFCSEECLKAASERWQ